MTYSIRVLRAMTDDQLIELHDDAAESATAGAGYYLDELRRRELIAAMKISHRLAMAATLLSVIAAASGVLALFLL